MKLLLVQPTRWQGIAFQDAAREAEKRGIEAAKSVAESQLTTMNPETGKPEALKIPEGFGQIAADLISVL